MREGIYQMVTVNRDLDEGLNVFLILREQQFIYTFLFQLTLIRSDFRGVFDRIRFNFRATEKTASSSILHGTI